MSTDKESIAKNLIRLRNSLNLSQEKFAEEAKVPISTYRNIELAYCLPEITTLKKIADAYKLDINIFLQPVKELKAVRFRADKDMKKRKHTLSLISLWLNDFNRIEKLLKEPKKYVFENFNNEKKMSPKEVAEFVRNKLELEDEPIKDICGVLENIGIKIYTKEFKSSDEFFGLSVAKEDGGPAIIVNTWDRITLERRIFSAAHEFGHLLLHLNSYNVSEWTENKFEEDEANEFASYFLMPEKAFEEEWNKSKDLDFVDKIFKIKAIYKVSYQVVLYRLKEYFKDKNIWGIFHSQYKFKTRGKTLTKKEEPEPFSKTYFFNSRLETLVGKALDLETGAISLQEAAFILEKTYDNIIKFKKNYDEQKKLSSLK